MCLVKKKAGKVLQWKNYEKGMRVHKITFQAMWEILMPQLLQFLENHDSELRKEIEKANSEESDESLISLLTTESFQDATNAFVQFKSKKSNYALWFVIYLWSVFFCILPGQTERVSGIYI